ncbi:hypothetical protein Agub_g11735 [Astrephomene gubernaculifera]|uniref:ASCH domain-containing protein n=1 Tax=Astrephomene gubernaculifera TaxID=47775 RepID=A0AAD3DZP0_9CHLO|nr:hypothetical protein Agub_g11735 [Astrephomene gubernaculifera]
MADEGLTCLSMHQPWASLLVYGIKRIEGRTWDSTHRGRLWIHATSKEVDPKDVEELHAFYTQVHGLDGRVPQFPPAYPTSVLLGCVEVVDVLPGAAVEEWPGLPESCRLEVGAPFCFLCQNPKRLVVPQPLKGQHKLWQIPRATLKVALQGLRDPPGLSPFSWRDFGDPRVLLAPPPTQPQQRRSQRQAGGTETAEGGKPSGATRSEEGKAKELESASHNGGADTAAAAGAGGDVGFLEGSAADLERRLRAVRKKLRQVSDLEACSGTATSLTPEQKAKLARAGEWRREELLLQEALARGAAL